VVDAQQPEFDKPIAVIDTNVIVDAISCVHMVKHYDAHPNIGPAAPESTLRRQKARESLLLSMYLNSSEATTYSIFEATRITVREIDPNADDAFENHALKIWIHYVKDNVLPNWVMIGPSSGDGEPLGNGADALLVQKAKEFGVPLISHEGVTVDGINSKSGIRKKAYDAQVKIMTAREFYGDMDEQEQSGRFMLGYARGAEAYARRNAEPTIMRESMLWLQGYYRHILYGITEGYTEPLPVRLP